MGDEIQSVLSQAATSTLVKYNNPCMVTTHGRRKPKFVIDFDAKLKSETEESGPIKIENPCTDGLNQRETEEILNVILPPKEWVDAYGNLWRQTVSSVPATRADVIALEEQLNTRLRQRVALETGICEERRALYTQCFEELIRQVTINCAERGLLLLRVRNEIRMTLNAYQSLYESATAYGMRKILMGESKKAELEKKIVEVSQGRGALEEAIQGLDLKLTEIDHKYADQRSSDEKKHAEDMKMLRAANLQVKQQLEGLLFPRKTAA